MKTRTLSAENGEWTVKDSMLQGKIDEFTMKERFIKGNNGEWRTENGE